MWKPENDGIDHLNVYSKGKTKLGRLLTNFARTPFVCEDGQFNSVEGYWYWLGCGNEALRTAIGFEAKKIGRESGAPDWISTAEFQGKIKAAIKAKLEYNPTIMNDLKACKLPLTHYYVYGNKVVPVYAADWILEFLESFKSQ